MIFVQDIFIAFVLFGINLNDVKDKIILYAHLFSTERNKVAAQSNFMLIQIGHCQLHFHLTFDFNAMHLVSIVSLH